MRLLIVFVFFIINLFAQNVLILNSYSIKLPWTKSELEGILSTLSKEDLKIYMEFMDTKVFRPTSKRVENFYNYLKNKYSGIKFDIVITTDDNALNFVRAYKSSFLFKNAKVFFAGVNNLKLANELDKNIYSGVFEKKEPISNLNFIKKINPDIKTIYVVADNSNSAKSVMKEYKKAFKNINNIKFVYINDQNLEEVIEKIKNASLNSAMMLLTPFSFYLKGNHINYKYAIALISDYFHYPIVIHTDLLAHLPNSNIVGGKVTDGISQGKEVAKKVIKYLKGASLKDIGFTFEKANQMYLNVKNLDKFGINAYSLGYKKAIYVNKPTSFYELYKEWIISAVILFFGVFTVTVILFIKNIQLKKYNFKIKDLNVKLEDKIQEAIDEIRKKEEKINLYKEEAFKKIINSMIFQLKYPIEKLYESKKFDGEIVEYLKHKIEEFENIFLNDSLKEKVSVKEVISEILDSVKPYLEAHNIKVEIKKSEDFFIEVNKRQFKQILFNIFKEIKNYLKSENPYIVICLEDKSITLKEKTSGFEEGITNSFNEKKDKKTQLEFYFSKIEFENCFNGPIYIKKDKNNSVVEIKLL